ncbi:MAG: TraB/GumN family protein [Prevotella sp.]|nr:TraB/GumN family protein [Prevotella sp.]
MKRVCFSLVFILFTIVSFAQESKNPGWVWAVSGNGLSQTSYLFGTCHGDGHNFTREEVFGITGLEGAVSNVKTVLFEMEMNPNKLDPADIKAARESNDKLMKWIKNPGPKYMMPEGAYYKPLFDSIAHFKEVDKYLTRKMKDMEYWKKTPGYWFSVISVVMFVSTRRVTTVETIMYEETVRRGYETGGLEKVNDIDGSLDTLFKTHSFLEKLSLKEQADTLYRAIKMIENGEMKRFLGEFAKAYLSNDTCKMYNFIKEEELLHKDSTAQAMTQNILLRKRNMAWLPAIKENMASQPTMIAVGCRHLLGSDGLIAILRKEGYMVEPVKNDLK